MQIIKTIKFIVVTFTCLIVVASSSVAQTLANKEVDSLEKIITTTPIDSTKLRAINRLAFHYLFVDVNKSLELLQNGIYEAEKLNELFCKAELLNTKATYFDISGQRDSAEITFNTSLKISKEKGYNNNEVMTLNSLGLFYWKSGAFEKALTYFFNALEINGNYYIEDKTSRANYLSNIGLIYQELNQYNKALVYHNKALDIRTQKQEINGQAISYANIGVCYQNLKNYKQAEQYFLKAINKAQAAKNLWMYHSLYDNLGNTYQLSNKNKEAIDAFKIALNKPDNLPPNPKSDLSIYTNLASLYNKLNQPKVAITYAQKGLSLLDEYKQLYLFSDGLFYANAEANYRIGNIEKGNQSMQQYKMVLDSVFSDKNAQALAELETKYELVKKDKTLLEQQQILQQQQLNYTNKTIWFITSIALLLITIGVLYYLFKRKQAIAKQASLELNLAEEKKHAQIQEERLRISRELHDNIGSYLTLINAWVEQLPELNKDELNQNLPQIQSTLMLSMRELRKTVWLLNNQSITIDAVVIRLRDFFKPLNQTQTKITIKAEGNTEQTLTDIQTTHFFRVLQEAVTNAYKHANANNININLVANHQLHFTITDDGVGFSTNVAKSGNGLQNIKSRMEELNGTLSINSQPNSGTTIEGSFSFIG